MVRLFYPSFAALALVSATVDKSKCLHIDDPFGGDGGEIFTDNVWRKTNTTGIFFRFKQRLDAVGIEVDGADRELHGGKGGNLVPHPLCGKKILEMEVHRAKHDHKLKVVYVKLTLDEGPPFTAGLEDKERKQKNIKTFTPEKEGSYLIGFNGRAHDEVNALGGIWLDPKCAKKEERETRKRRSDDSDDGKDDGKGYGKENEQDDDN